MGHCTVAHLERVQGRLCVPLYYGGREGRSVEEGRGVIEEKGGYNEGGENFLYLVLWHKQRGYGDRLGAHCTYGAVRAEVLR